MLPPILYIQHLFSMASYSIRCIGSYRLFLGTPHLHGEFNFTESMLETVGQSCHHSCGALIRWQGISLPQNRQSYGCRLLGLKFGALSNNRIHPSLSVSSTGQVSDSILSVTTLQSPVFLINSRHPLFCATFLEERSSFFQSYGGNLPSSFNMVFSIALVYSTSSPVLVQVRSFPCLLSWVKP